MLAIFSMQKQWIQSIVVTVFINQSHEKNILQKKK